MTTTITLKEISLVSGYSVSTVSKALNNKLDISARTREIIKTIANQHNYVPNSYAVALRKKKTKVISVIVPQINLTRYSSFIYNFETVASSNGYRIILFQSFEEQSKETDFIKTCNDGSVDGVMLITNNKLVCNSYTGKYNIPIECVTLEEFLTTPQLEKASINGFNKLLAKINKD